MSERQSILMVQSKMKESKRKDVTHITLTVLLIAVLIIAVYLILHPFLPPFIWATTIVITTWPLMLRAQETLWGKRGLAVLVMTLGLLLVFVVPLWVSLATIADNYRRIDEVAASFYAAAIPPPPSWIQKLPLIGPNLAATWQDLATAGPEGIIARIKPYSGQAAKWFIDQAGNLGKILVQFLLTVIISTILYARGEVATTGIRRFAERLGGKRGEEIVSLVEKSIRGVAMGVVVTALAQSLLGGIGLAAAGVPAAVALTAIMFVLCLAQLGPGLVLLPAVVWLFWSSNAIAGSLLLVWTAGIVSLDNILRPMLIKRGADLPLLLVFAGVIGGLIAFGIVGIFIGPVVLAVAFTLLKSWVEDNRVSQPLDQ